MWVYLDGTLTYYWLFIRDIIGFIAVTIILYLYYSNRR